MFTFLEYVLIAFYIAGLLIFSRWIGQQAFSWMPVQATAEAQRVDDLFSFLVSIGAFILLGLLGVIVYAIIFHRARQKDYSEGHSVRGDARIEFLWTAVPTLLVLWIALKGFSIYQQLNILGLQQIVHLHTPLESPAYAAVANKPQPATETIDVFVKQWEWSFHYPNNLISKELHLPVNRSTRLNLYAQDVIHGFYVPAFRLKQDIIPKRDIGIVLTPIRSGKYRLKDSQFSGTYFALMEADVYVEPLDRYNQWLTQTTANQSTQTEDWVVAKGIEAPKTFFNSGWQTFIPASPAIAKERKVSNDT